MPVEVGGIKLHRVHKIVTLEQGAFVYHRIPGLEGNVVQDLGRDSVRLQIEGIFYGPEAQDGLEGLRDVYKAREPVDFLAEVIGQAYFGQVILERFEVSQLAGEPEQFSYSLVVTEYVKPPEPATAAAASVEQAIKLDADLFMEMATLPDMLALGEIPELTNPVAPLTGALDPIAAAVKALQGATQALTGLFAHDGDGGTPPEIPPDWGAHPPTPLDWGPSPDGRGGQAPDTSGALRDRNGAPLLGPHGELLGRDGRSLLGPDGELLGPDGQPILGLNGQPLGADGALRDRNGNPILGPDGELLGPDGQPVLGPNGALLGPDGQALRGPNGELLGAQGELLGPDGQPVLGPNGELLDADGNPLLGPDGELLGPDGQALLDEDGQPLGPDGQAIAIARLTVVLRNEVSEPVPGAAYALTLGAEEIEHGWLNMQGQVQVKGLKTETDYTLTFFDGLEAGTVRTGWVVIVLTDEAGAPVAGTWYVLSLEDGSTRAGTLDTTGQAALTELEPGRTYRLSFPAYALTVWGLVEEMRPPTMRTGWAVITLVDEAGAPVAGAAYVLSLVDGSTRAGTLDATGQAGLTELGPGQAYRLSFPAYDLTAWSRAEEQPRPVPQPGRVAITLVDEAGDPVPAVRYVLTLADGSTQQGWLDATGQALLAGLVSGRAYRLSFPEVAPAAWRSADEVQAPGAQPGWVTITVVDETEAPITGARYVLSLADGSTHEDWLDAAGQALLTGLEPGGAYRLTLPDYDRPTWESLEANRAAAAGPGWVTVALVDEADAPMAGAAYVLTLADGSTRTGTLEADGQAVMADLEPGVAYALSFPAYDLTAFGRIEESQAVAPSGWVALALVDDVGLPMGGTSYVLTLVDGSTYTDTLDDAGRALLAHLEPSIAHALSFPAYEETAWHQSTEIHAAATPAGWVQLTLVDEVGAPVAGAVYVLTLADGSTRTGVLNTAGEAALMELAGGMAYSLSFSEYNVTAWGRVEELQALTTQAGWVRVALVDETGTPMAGAVYVLTLPDGTTCEGALDAIGQALIAELEPGLAYGLSFPQLTAPAWGQVEEQPILVLQPGWVRLALVDEAGVPVAGAAYVLTLADGSTRVGALDAEGQAVVVDLEPGAPYRLSFPAYDLTAWGHGEEPQAVAPLGWAALALVDDAGLPVGGASYVLTLADGRTREGTLDAAGQVVLAGLDPGIAYGLTFPDYDRAIWGRVDAGRTAEARSGWVAMTLVDEAGAPMAGAAYVLTLEDGNTREGTLDAAGQALLEDLELGRAYRLSFPQVAATAWGRDDAQAAESQPGWIAVTLVDEAGAPMAGVVYVLTLADGSTSEGCLDRDGQAVLVGLEPGQVYRLSFPEYDGAGWDLAQG